MDCHKCATKSPGPHPAHCTPEKRFWRKVAVMANGCWEWQGMLNNQGYGKHSIGHRPVYAHRFSYESMVGDLAPHELVLHRCDNPKCVRPAHLMKGSHKDNARDMVEKGRGRKPVLTTHCRKGHPLVGRNAMRRHDGGKLCRECYNSKRRKGAARTYYGQECAHSAALNDKGICAECREAIKAAKSKRSAA